MPHHRAKPSVLAALVAGLLLSVATPALAQTASAPLRAKSPMAGRIESALTSGGSVRVIVRHATPDENLRSGLDAARAAAATASLQDGILRSAAPTISARSRHAVRQITTMPMFALTVDRAELGRLAADPKVERIWIDDIMTTSLDESVGIVGGLKTGDGGSADPDAGRGTTIVVLDTGVDARHPFLAGRVTREACFSSAIVAEKRTSLCPSGEASQIGPGSAQPAAGRNLDHGTHVAGIAAGRRTATGGPARGVAPGAEIFAIQLFSSVDGQPRPTARTSDMLAALAHLVSVADDIPAKIASVNMSLGGGEPSTNACDDDPRKIAFDALRAKGISMVVAAGNNGSRNGITRPACITTSFVVGSTDKVNAVSVFSNIAPNVAVLAPGTAINSAVIGREFRPLNGTSMAAPHVAGAVAVLKSRFPAATIDQVEGALRTSGIPIRDARSEGRHTLPRIDLARAIEVLRGARAEPPAPTTPPPGPAPTPSPTPPPEAGKKPDCPPVAASDPSSLLRGDATPAAAPADCR